MEIPHALPDTSTMLLMKKAILRWFICALLVLLAVAAKAEEGTPAPAAAADGAPITFNKHIAPIIFQNCTSCHRTGEVAPFPLVTFEDVSKRAKQIARVTKSRFMPPWKAEDGYGEFLDARRLSSDQIALIQKWFETGAAEGDAKDLPPPPKYPEGWSLGTPDLIVQMPEAYTVAAEGRDDYRCFVIPLNLAEDKYVSAVEYRPSNRKVVHHAIFFLDTLGQARKKDAADPGPGFKSFGGPGFLPTGGLGGWAPGAFPRFLPDNTAKLLKKGSDLIVQTHFHPSGKPEQEQSSVGIYFSKAKVNNVVAGFAMRSRDIDIPANDANYKVSSTFTVPANVQILGLTPHAHLLCKDIHAKAALPDGTTKPLIWIKDWDFNWQDQYLYASPLRLPKGTVVSVEFTYDNSAENIRNPSTPPKRVRWGEQTTDEMALLFFQVLPENPADAGTLRRAMVSQAIQEGAAKVGEALKRMAGSAKKD